MLKSEEDLKAEMLFEALLIIKSVDFVEKQLHTKYGELEEAYNNNFYEDIPLIEKQILNLVAKVGEENRNMDIYMNKYKKEGINEKETILSGVK